MSSTDTGYGFQTPYDSASEQLGAAFIFRQLLSNIDTVKIVKVVAVKPGEGTPPLAGTVDVEILVNQVDGATPPNSTPSGNVYGLPYLRVRFGVWEIVGDPAVGDIGIALCADRDVSTVKNTKAQANPGSLRQHDVADGLFFGGCLNGAPLAYFWGKSDGTFNITDKPGNVIISSSAGIAVTTAMGGDLTVNGISVTKHTHPVAGISTGSGDVETGEPVG